MSFQGRSLLELKSLSKSEVESFFQKANRFRSLKEWPQNHFSAGLIFLENSTRTTGSFEIATKRLGGHTLKITSHSSSVAKGESLLDTCLTLQALDLDLLIVRHGTNETLADIAGQLRIPIVNAGEGVVGHPTQGLLDALTVINERGPLPDQRVLIVGDAKHSRVAASAAEIFELFGAEVGYCGPKSWLPLQGNCFENLSEGLQWCTVVMALRIQSERHQEKDAVSFSETISKYQLNNTSLAALRSDGLILHPGPFNRGVEISDDVLLDARCCIWKQVQNGVFIRAAVISEILGFL